MKPFILQLLQQNKLQQNKNIMIFEQHHINNEESFKDPNYYTIMLNSNKIPNISYNYSDNIGNNISNKNLTYVDLTGVYWIWKNIHNSIYKGNVHYKRFFTTNDHKILSSNEILNLLKDNNKDCLISECARLEGRTVYQIFNDFHGHENMDECYKVIKDIKPEYVKDFENVIINGEYSSLFNMMIAKNNIFNDYCEWLFSILFELENRLQNKGALDNLTEEDYQRKIFGFIGERLMLVWLKHNNIQYLENPVTIFYNGLNLT